MDVRGTVATSASRRARGALAAMLAAALALLACAAPGSSPGPSLAVRAATLDGTTVALLVAGPEGMRGRAGFDGADGMLFDLGVEVDPGAVAFVMDGVDLPLDIAWFDADGTLVGTATLDPCAAEPCPRVVAPGPFRWAIEAPRGAFDDLAPDARLIVPGA